MDIETLLIVAALCLLPISELRGGLPYAIVRGIPLPVAYLYCVALNALAGPLLYFFLSTFHRWFLRFPPYEKLFGHLVERARTKVGSHISTYGYLGLAVFVAIPLPVTGAYTGALGAWFFGMNPKRTFVAIALGVAVAGIIISLVTVLGIEALSFFIKQPELLNGH